jgi:hypothetical protein
MADLSVHHMTEGCGQRERKMLSGDEWRALIGKVVLVSSNLGPIAVRVVEVSRTGEYVCIADGMKKAWGAVEGCSLLEVLSDGEPVETPSTSIGIAVVDEAEVKES